MLEKYELAKQGEIFGPLNCSKIRNGSNWLKYDKTINNVFIIERKYFGTKF
jgi:hypothetical protein